jgi:DNA-binding beta-propeller fold protein YncE
VNHPVPSRPAAARRAWWQAVSFCLLLSVVGLAAIPAAGFHLLKKIPGPDDAGWDYLIVDDTARRLYVSHNTHVDVFDADSGAVAGKIANTDGVHGIAIARESGRGFTSNGRASTVTIFDLKTLKPLGEVKTGKGPDAIIYDPSSKRVFAFNGGGDSATAIDSADGKVAGTIELGGGPEFAVADGGGHVFVNLEDKSELVKLDSQKLAVSERWAVAPCESPSSMAMDRKNRRIFIGCRNRKMAVVNADTGKVITTVPIGDRVDASAWDPDAGLIFNSNGDGTMTVVHQDSPDKYTVVENVKTQSGSKTMALDMKTHHLFLPAASYGPSPAPTAQQPRPRPPMLPGSFTILVLGQ